RDQDARPLAAREFPDRLTQMFRIEKKFGGPCGHVNHAILINHGIAVRRERAAQTDVRIKLAILIEIYNSQRIGTADFSTGRLDVSAQEAKQRRLATPVGPHEPHSHPRSNREMDSRE